MPLLLALRWWEQGLTVAPPPTPAPEAECYPRFAAPVTAFSRATLPGSSFSRDSVASSFTRLGAPVDVALGGWGDDWGFDFGGAALPELAFGLPPAAPIRFDRIAAASPAYARGSVSGSAFARMAAPGCDPGLGFGDSFGMDFGGEADADCLVPVAAPITSYNRGAVGVLASTRSGLPATPLARMDAPECVAGVGWGDDFGFTFGGA